jgi:hypothetical protein
MRKLAVQELLEIGPGSGEAFGRIGSQQHGRLDLRLQQPRDIRSLASQT